MALRVCGRFCLGSLNKMVLYEPSFISSYQTKRCLSSDMIPPKRPLTGYMKFVTAKREQVLKANPGVTKLTEVGKILGAMWRQLPDHQKEQYKEKYGEEWKVYQKNLDTYRNNLSEEERIALEKNKKALQQKRAKKKLKKLAKEYNRPKKPAAAFISYVNDHALERGDAPITEYIAGMARHWNKMAIEDKQVYYDKYAKAQLQYENDLYEWEEKMLMEGKSQLIRAFIKPKAKKTKTKKKKSAKTPSKSKSKKVKKATKKESVDSDQSWMREE